MEIETEFSILGNFWLFFSLYLCLLWHDIYSLTLCFCSLESNRVKTPQTVSICIKLCQLYRTLLKSSSYRVKSSIRFCSNLHESNSCGNFTTLSDSFCASLIKSVTVKSNNWNLAWSELSYINFCLQSLELHQSLFVERFIHNTERILCVTKDPDHWSKICDSLLGFTFHKVYILIPLWTTERQFYTTFKKFMILVITWMHNRNSTIIVSVFSFLTYIFKLFIWGLFYLIVRFIVLFY